MKTYRSPWARLPVGWIEENGLQRFTWRAHGSNSTAALLVLIVLAHHQDPDTGIAKITYSKLCLAANLSRLKVSEGLKLLAAEGLLRCSSQSTYQLLDPIEGGRWGKLPCSKLYNGDTIRAFGQIHLRSPAELDAIKIYMLFVARRNWATDWVNLTYDSISEYSGMDRSRIKPALSLLTIWGLIFTDHRPSKNNLNGVTCAYRLAHLSPYRHMGTTGRGMEEADFSDVVEV